MRRERRSTARAKAKEKSNREKKWLKKKISRQNARREDRELEWDKQILATQTKINTIQKLKK